MSKRYNETLIQHEQVVLNMLFQLGVNNAALATTGYDITMLELTSHLVYKMNAFVTNYNIVLNAVDEASIYTIDGEGSGYNSHDYADIATVLFAAYQALTVVIAEGAPFGAGWNAYLTYLNNTFVPTVIVAYLSNHGLAMTQAEQNHIIAFWGSVILP